MRKATALVFFARKRAARASRFTARIDKPRSATRLMVQWDNVLENHTVDFRGSLKDFKEWRAPASAIASPAHPKLSTPRRCYPETAAISRRRHTPVFRPGSSVSHGVTPPRLRLDFLQRMTGAGRPVCSGGSSDIADGA